MVKHFLPKHAIPGNETLQNAFDSYYAERRQAAAQARAVAHEATRQAEMDRLKEDAQSPNRSPGYKCKI